MNPEGGFKKRDLKGAHLDLEEVKTSIEQKKFKIARQQVERLRQKDPLLHDKVDELFLQILKEEDKELFLIFLFQVQMQSQKMEN